MRSLQMRVVARGSESEAKGTATHDCMVHAFWQSYVFPSCGNTGHSRIHVLIHFVLPPSMYPSVQSSNHLLIP